MGNQGKKEARGTTRHRDKTQFRHQVTLNAQGQVSRSARGPAEALGTSDQRLTVCRYRGLPPQTTQK